jgi:RNA polymerase sigma factor (sigma-70 family)
MEAEATSIGRPAVSTAVGTAFERLFLQHYRGVAAIAYRVLADADEAEDVAQEVFLSFHKSRSPDDPRAAGWLRAAAAHVALNHVRGEKRRDRRETVFARDGDRVADPESETLRRERRDEARAALARLPRAAAELLALRYSGLSYAEVAEALDIPADQIGTRLRRAQEAFKKEVLHGQDGRAAQHAHP